MERLTERDEYGNADIVGVDSGELQLNLEFEEFNLVTGALNRLAEYEDTGLAPEEIKDIKSCLDIEGDGHSGEDTLNDLLELMKYRKTGLTPQNIICREDDIKLLQQQNKEFREEILKLRNQRQLDITELQDLSFALIDMHDECDFWKHEAIKAKAQLGEIRILAEKNEKQKGE